MAAGGLLLLGAEGQLGQEIRRLAGSRDLALTALNRKQLDITDAGAVKQALERGYGTVINAAAYTAVDKAESDEALAMAVNRDGAAHLAQACRDGGAALIQLSTDYVFDGLKGAGYREGDPVRPLSVYGRGKLAGEEAVRAALPAHVILRTSWVFGAWGTNFVKTMLRLGGEREELSIVADQFGCPTPTAALADAVLAVAERLAPETYGSYHCAGAERTSWYDFARAIFAGQEELTGRKGPKLRPIATVDYPTAARRPPDSTLDSGLFQATFGQGPIDWRRGLSTVLQELLVPQEKGQG
ncbi:dTDP-4-dehydrorhamnose reductase [Pelagibius sp. CAU 1746]|uniref:dTDP-4-dehydrorhamnose reductase n=1 Tax=Pelagibius sp. CAU 1746 TaxID=3140370 RepID=UPI00325AA631